MAATIRSSFLYHPRGCAIVAVMSVDPSPAPQSHVVDNIEGARSTSPAQGVGLVHTLLDPSNFIGRKGRVEDIYMDKFCAAVSIYGYRKAIPCQWAMPAFNRWSGARAIDQIGRAHV